MASENKTYDDHLNHLQVTPLEAIDEQLALGGSKGLPDWRSQKGFLRWVFRFDALIASVDSALVALCLFASAGCAALGFLFRLTGFLGTPWLDLIPQFATLAIAFFGASLAARCGGHLALDLASHMFKKGTADKINWTANVLASLISAMLTWASWQFIQNEHEAATTILQTIPTWVPALPLLWGFGLATFRFSLRATVTLPITLLISPLILTSLIALATYDADLFFPLGIALIVAAMLLGAPLFTILGATAMLFFWYDDVELSVVPTDIIRLKDAPALVTLPLFTLLGTILSQGGAPHRLVTVARAWLGWLPGGLLIATVTICAFFTTFTGASGVTILALGMLLFKLLKEEGYSDDLAIGTITSSGSIGLLFAPALPLIVYGIVAKVDIDHMFRAGVLPGILLIICVAGVAIYLGHNNKSKNINNSSQTLYVKKPNKYPFNLEEGILALKENIWDLALPALLLIIILGGFGTVVEAAACGVLYTVAVALFIHKDISSYKKLPAICTESATLIGAVLVVVAVALSFTNLLVDREVPQTIVEWIRENVESPMMFLLLLNLLLLVVGCILDIFSAIVIFVPLLLPAAESFGIHKAHLGIIFLANLELGYLTPPVGMNLFLAAFRFDKTLPQIWRTTIPFLIALAVALACITYIPLLSLWGLE